MKARFTVKPLDWESYLEPVDLAEADAEQLDALKVTPSNTKVSAYVRLLVHDVESYRARMPLFNAIMYAKGGLGRADRELGALAASVYNRCVYCASTHARRFIEQGGRDGTVESIYRHGEAAELDERSQAIFDFSLKLSATPPTASKSDVDLLRAHGLDTLDILDLIHSVAIFGWANRLMHTLGRPIPKA